MDDSGEDYGTDSPKLMLLVFFTITKLGCVWTLSKKMPYYNAGLFLIMM